MGGGIVVAGFALDAMQALETGASGVGLRYVVPVGRRLPPLNGHGSRVSAGRPTLSDAAQARSQ